jgi:5'-nucleotidase
MRILVTNDDGIGAPGLACLVKALERLGEVWIVAPDREQSAASHALTLRDPLRVIQHGEREFSVSGTPTDCVLVSVRGIRGLLEPVPDLVVSGINHGPNMGDDVTYSGTVAAAFEGRLLGLPAVAFSNTEWKPRHLESSARIARQIVETLVSRGLPRETLLNVNIPDLPLEEILGIRVTRLGFRVYRDEIIAKVDPRGRPYFWIGGDPPIWEMHDESDFSAVSEGYVSMTPLQTDWTDQARLEALSAWRIPLPAPGAPGVGGG